MGLKRPGKLVTMRSFSPLSFYGEKLGSRQGSRWQTQVNRSAAETIEQLLGKACTNLCRNTGTEQNDANYYNIYYGQLRIEDTNYYLHELSEHMQDCVSSVVRSELNKTIENRGFPVLLKKS